MSNPVDGYVFASPKRRVTAAFVDWVITLALAVLLGYVYISWIVYDNGEHPTGQVALGIVFIWPLATYVFAVIIHMVFAFGIGAAGETPGQRCLGLSVQRTDGSPVGRRRALFRGFIGSPCVLTLSLASVLLVIPFFLEKLFDVPEFGWVPFWFFAMLAVAAAPFLFVANHVIMSGDAKHQGIHDLIADTFVVKIRTTGR